MNATNDVSAHDRYDQCVRSSKRVYWDIDLDVIRGRRFDSGYKFLPDGLSLADTFKTLSPSEKKFVSQIQGRTYANIFGLVERFINAKVLELARGHALGDQVALEAMMRLSNEELKHQELFRRIDGMIGEVLPSGYRFDVDPDAVARAVLGRGTWAVLALTLDIELFTQSHYRQSIDHDAELSELFKDVFLHHWKEESQHAILDELELMRHTSTLTAQERDRGVDELIELIQAVDGILRAQAASDAAYFATNCARELGEDETGEIRASFLAAYRWQYIHSGAQHPHFAKVLSLLITEGQGQRIQAALASLQYERGGHFSATPGDAWAPELHCQRSGIPMRNTTAFALQRLTWRTTIATCDLPLGRSLDSATCEALCHRQTGCSLYEGNGILVECQLTCPQGRP
jgi:hypothetical protein